MLSPPIPGHARRLVHGEYHGHEQYQQAARGVNDELHPHRAKIGSRQCRLRGKAGGVADQLHLHEQDAGIPREFVVQYVVGAFMAVMTWWLDAGAKLSPQRIDAMFRRLAIEGITQSYF